MLRQWCVMKKHSVTNPNVFVIFNVICSSSGGATSLVSLSRPTTCKPVDSSPMASLPTGTVQYWGLIFNSLGERGSKNGWHILSSKVLRLRKNPSSAWEVARNSNIWATICDKIRQKSNRDLQWSPKILGTAYGYLPLTVKMRKNPQRRQKFMTYVPQDAKINNDQSVWTCVFSTNTLFV